MSDLSKIFDLSQKFAPPDTLLKSKNYCTDLGEKDYNNQNCNYLHYLGTTFKKSSFVLFSPKIQELEAGTYKLLLISGTYIQTNLHLRTSNDKNHILYLRVHAIN